MNLLVVISTMVDWDWEWEEKKCVILPIKKWKWVAFTPTKIKGKYDNLYELVGNGKKSNT